MKISRQAPARRRRSPISILPILLLVLIGGLLVVSWMKGAQQPQKTIEIDIPAERLGH